MLATAPRTMGGRVLARELGIAERTVKAHIARIVEMLDQQTRLQVTVLAVPAHEELCSDPRCECRETDVPPGSLMTAARWGCPWEHKHVHRVRGLTGHQVEGAVVCTLGSVIVLFPVDAVGVDTTAPSHRTPC